jgi:signal transduction histidine kinase
VKIWIRLHLFLQLAALAAASALVLVAVGLPLLASRALGPRAFLLLVALDALVVLLVGTLILFRWVGRPLDRLLVTAGRLGADGPLPPLGPQGEQGAPSLARAALAFERTAAELAEERIRLAAKLAELEAANGHLAQAREGLRRSEKLATVGRLAAGVAHEVGNPLAAISGYAELARAKQADGSADRALLDDYLGRIVAEARRIDAIVRDLLDFARPAGLDLGPVELEGALAAAVRLARVQARFREVELVVALPAGLPAVRADEGRLVQVFLNVLLNAGDAMEGCGVVRVWGLAEADQVVVEVVDTGPGIAPEHLSRVFDPFFTTKEPGQGTGLGLAICHGILDTMGGGIEAAAAEGGGARFTVRLPRWDRG